MHQKDIEKLAFMYICEEYDKYILSGKTKMKFEDFERLDYLTDVLNFANFNRELWKEYSRQFQDQFDILKISMESNDSIEGSMSEVEEEIHKRTVWKRRFLEQLPKDAVEVLTPLFEET